MRRRVAASVVALFMVAAPAAAQRSPLADLDAPLRAAAARAGGTVGIAVVDASTGERWSLNGGHAFPMMSVYKVPIAVAVLDDVARGALALDDSFAFRARDTRPFRSPLTREHPRGGVTLSLGDLLAASVHLSDNAAVDRLLGIAGGPEAVTGSLRRLGVRGVRVDREEGAQAMAQLGVAMPPDPDRWSLAMWDSIIASVPDSAAAAPLRRWMEDGLDTATPDGMADMLAALAKGELLPARETRLLLGWMTDPASQPRLRARLPEGVTLYDKAGTSLRAGGVSGAINDVGILEFSDGRRVVVAVFVMGSRRDPDEVRDAIAEVGRVVAERFSRADGAARD